MSPDRVVQLIKGEILTIISNYIELKKSGPNYMSCCPFHDEKTPSLSVNQGKGIFKCFGCNKGGDAIEFIKEYEGVDFKQAVEIGAKKLNLDFRWNDDVNFDHKKYKHIESMHVACNIVEKFFNDNLSNSNAQNYIDQHNIALPDTDNMNIGYAPKGNALISYAKSSGVNTEILEEIGVVKNNEKGVYDFFRNRLIFPIANSNGQTIAFAGRDISDDPKVKYLNTSESKIYTKGNELYGLNAARFTIKNENRVYVVEGYTDVLRMQAVGVINTVATCGTALTLGQIELIGRSTSNVTLIYDGDSSGIAAIDRNAKLLIENKFNVSVIILPEKQDPDSLFVTKKIFDEYNEKQLDYILYKTSKSTKRSNTDPTYKAEIIKEIAGLIVCYDKYKQDIYIDFVTEYVKPKKAWQETIKSLTCSEEAVIQQSIPKHVSLSEFNRWGFYVENNCYVFRNKKGDDFVKLSNFVLTPLFHVESIGVTKRLFEVKNKKNEMKILELEQKDLVSLYGFNLKIEDLGNFLWEGDERELKKIKAWLYDKTKSCKEIIQMGWQKEGFWVWGNGIFADGSFQKADKYGIVKFGNRYYYLPSCSDIYASDDSVYKFERRFVHENSNISLFEYSEKYYKVFGKNGLVALAFYFASLHLDIVSKRFDQFPLLNMYGQKGSGKNTCAEGIVYMFGKKVEAPNLHNTSKPAIAEHVAASANSVCILDEYRNDLEMEKRELLKGFWDRTGRTRMNMDKDKRRETSGVDQGVVVCGQQIATADIALFTRFIAIGFTQTVFSKEEREAFEDLKEINKRGLTGITHQLLKERESFSKLYSKTVDLVDESFRKLLGTSEVETRIFNNWLTIASAFSAVSKIIKLPFDHDETIKQFVSMMILQNKETARNDDLGIFWKVVEYLISSNMLFEGGDYKVVYTDRINRTYKENGKWQKTEAIFKEPKEFLYLSVSRVFALYKTQALREGDKPLPDATVEYYLKNSPAFVCDSKKVSFKKIDVRNGMQEVDDSGKKKFTSTSAFVFHLDQINLSVESCFEE